MHTRNVAHPLLALAALALAPANAFAQELTPPRLGDAPPLTRPESTDHAERTVSLRVTIAADGTVSDAVLADPTSAPADDPFVVAALAWIRTARFVPATRNGTPIPATIPFDAHFDPPGAPNPDPVPVPVPVPESDPESAPAPAPAPAPSHAHPTHHHHDVAEHEHETPNLFEDAPAYGATARIETGAGEPMRAAASELDLDVTAFRDVPRRTAEDQLTLAPGMVLTNHSGIGHASTMFLRGFDAGEGQDVEVLVDGIPLNEPSAAHGHGYADANFIVPELVERVRVLEGPFDARQGDFAVAGTVEYGLGLPERGLLARGSYGSFDDKRVALVWGPEGASDGTFVGVELRDGDGFGPNRAHQRAGVIGQYEHEAGSLRIAVTGAAHAQQFDSAGVIRQDDYEARRLPCEADADSQFFCLYDPHQGGSASRYVLGGRIEHKGPGLHLGQQLFIGVRESRFRENFTGYLLDDRGDGLDQQYQTTTAGLRGFLRTQAEALGHPQRFEIGYLARHDRGNTRSLRIRREDAVPYDVVFDDDIAITNIAVHALGELRGTDWLGLRLGLRLDTFAFSVVDKNQPLVDRTGERLGFQSTDAFGVAISPRGSVVVTIVPGLDWVTSAGVGTRSSDAIALSEGERAPFARVVASETGLALERRDGEEWSLDARAIGFFTWVDQDLLFDPQRGRNVPIGASSRYGALLTAQGSVGSWLDALASFTWSEAHLPLDGSLFGEGPRLPYAPRFVLRVDAAVSQDVKIVRETVRLGGAVGVTWVGARPLPLEQLSEPIFSTDLSVRAGWRFVDLSFSVENLFDQRNQLAQYSYASNFEGPDATPSLVAERHFSAGTSRAFFVTLSLHADTAWLTGGDT